jgi:hypothetical protein
MEAEDPQLEAMTNRQEEHDRADGINGSTIVANSCVCGYLLVGLARIPYHFNYSVLYKFHHCLFYTSAIMS